MEHYEVQKNSCIMSALCPSRSFEVNIESQATGSHTREPFRERPSSERLSSQTQQIASSIWTISEKCQKREKRLVLPTTTRILTASRNYFFLNREALLPESSPNAKVLKPHAHNPHISLSQRPSSQMSNWPQAHMPDALKREATRSGFTKVQALKTTANAQKTAQNSKGAAFSMPPACYLLCQRLPKPHTVPQAN